MATLPKPARMSFDPDSTQASSHSTLPPEGSVRMASLLPIPGLMTKAGVDPDEVITEAGLDPALFESPENTIPFVDLGRFVTLCVRRSRCAHLGLLVGETMGTDVLGLVGRLAASAVDVRGGLQSIVEYLHLHDRGALPSVWVGGDRAAIAYVIHEPDVSATEQIYDAAMANAYNILKALAGRLWEPIEVRFSRPRPAALKPYRCFFRTRLRFEADENAVVFPSYWLDVPVVTADAQSRQALLKQVETLLEREVGDAVLSLRRLLRRLLIEGAIERKIDLETVAAMNAVHRRTLNRRLRAKGTSFKEQLAAARFDVARQLLRDTRLPVIKIALTLGYSDAPTFTRAFQRWSGTSPGAWRSRNG